MILENVIPATTGVSPAETWRLTYFGTTDNFGDAADDADPEADGINNTLERAFAQNPLAVDVSLLPRAVRNLGGYFQIQFTRDTTATDLTYFAEVSSDFVTWTTLASSTAGAPTVASGAHSVIESGGGALRTVTVEDATPASLFTARFFRIHVTGN